MENTKAQTYITCSRQNEHECILVGQHLKFDTKVNVFSLLLASTSLLGWHWLGHSLGTSIGLVHLGPLGQNGLLKIRTIIIGNRRFRNDILHSSEIVRVDGGRLGGFLWLRGGLGAGLGEQGGRGFSIRRLCANHVNGLAVGQTGALEARQGLDIALFKGKANRTRTGRTAIRLAHEGSVLLSELPNERIGDVNHFCGFWGVMRN
jgi:hypothetical protein